MNIKTLTVILFALAVISASVFGVVYTNGKTEIANAAVAKAEREASAAESAEKEARSAEKAAKAKLDAAKAAERKAEEDRKTAELQLAKSKTDALTAEENRKKAEAEKSKAADDRARAEAEAQAAADNRAAEKQKAETAKIERDKAKILVEAETQKAQAAADQLEKEKLASEKILAEKKLYDLRLLDIERMERELAEYKMELDERERALHPEKTVRDIDSVTEDSGAKSKAELNLPENNPEIPRSSRKLYRAERILGESESKYVESIRSNSIERLEKQYITALKEDRIVDADFYKSQLKAMYPDWKFTKKETEEK